MYRKHSDARIPVDARFSRHQRRPARPCPPFDPRRDATRSRSSSAPTTPCSSGRCRRASSSTSAASWFTPSAARARFLRRRDGRQGLDVLELVEARAEDGSGRRPQARLVEPAAIVFRGVRVSERESDRGLQGDHPAHRQPRRRRAPPARLVRGRRRRRAAATPQAETEVEMDQVSRDRLRRPRGRAGAHQGEPPGGDRGAGDQQRGAAGQQRGAPGVATRSSRARTKSSRASTRSSTRSTPSTSARSAS